MHIVVCIKSVMVKAPSDGVARTPEACDLNPFDRPALETALTLREEHGGSVTALSMGPDTAMDALQEAVAMGVDRGVLLSDTDLTGSDTLATSTALTAAIKKLGPFDLLLFGTRTADSDTGQVGPQTAVLLDLPLITYACSIELENDLFRVSRRQDGFLEEFKVQRPCVLTIHPTAAQARDVSLQGIEQAFARDVIETLSLPDIGLLPGEVGDSGSPTRVLSMTRVTKERRCELIEGSVEEQADELLRRLIDRGLMGL